MSQDQDLREKLVDVGEHQMQQNQQVINMNKMMEDTNQRAQAGLENLYRQGHQLDRINIKGKEINYEISKVDKTTKTMRRRQFYMNCLLYTVAICLFIALVVILGVRVSNRI